MRESKIFPRCITLLSRINYEASHNATFRKQPLLTFPNPQNGDERRTYTELADRGDARRTFHSQRRASSAFTKGYIYMWRRARRRAIVGISLSPGLLPSARASVQRERRMSVTYRARVPLIRNGRTYRPLIIFPHGERGQR